MERGRHARRWSSTRNAGRRGALRGGLGSKTHNAFCSALGPGRGRRRKAVNRVERNKSKLQLICPSTWSNSYRPAVQPQGFTPDHLQRRVNFQPALTTHPKLAEIVPPTKH